MNLAVCMSFSQSIVLAHLPIMAKKLNHKKRLSSSEELNRFLWSKMSILKVLIESSFLRGCFCFTDQIFLLIESAISVLKINLFKTRISMKPRCMF
jgi:hypothetical protein